MNCHAPKRRNIMARKLNSKLTQAQKAERYTPSLEDEIRAKEYAQRAITHGYITPSQADIAILNANKKIPNHSSSKREDSKSIKSNSSTNTVTTVYNAYAAAIERQNALLRQQQELARQRREAQMNATINANNLEAEKSLNDAYILNMMQKKNLPQELKSLGISGGVSESTLSDIENTYMNNSANIDMERNNANAKARLSYENGVNDDYSDYLAKYAKLNESLISKAFAKSSSKRSESKQDKEKSSLGAINNSAYITLDDGRVVKYSDLTESYKKFGFDPDEINNIIKQHTNKKSKKNK